VYNFLHSGGADLVASVASIASLFVVCLITLRQIRKGKVKVGPAPEADRMQAALEMFHRAIKDHTHEKWLRWWPESNTRFRLTVDDGYYVVERVELSPWPPEPYQIVRVVCLLINKTSPPLQYAVDVEAAVDGSLPVAISLNAGNVVVHGTLYVQTEPEVDEILQWTYIVSGARSE
jgi:hypothetical protein